MNVQADLSLCWRHMSEGIFSQVAALIFLLIHKNIKNMFWDSYRIGLGFS